MSTKPNVVWLSLLSPEDARRTLEGFEERREGVTVFCGEKASPASFPWAVGAGEVSKEYILHEYSTGTPRSFGGWWDEERGVYLWEAVALFLLRTDALYYAELRGEKCIFNLVTGEEIWL